MLTYPAPLYKIAKQLRTGELDLFNYINEACDRIDNYDRQILAMLPEPGRRERLLQEAAILRERHPDPGGRPALFGVLVGVKDIYRVNGFSTRGGSALDPVLFEGEEAQAVQLLRRSGALILGKTVTTEFAGSEPGSTRNPHNLDHTPGGSSSGSAAAVAAGFCPLALGSQTTGSTIRPAAFCGIVGYKPSYGSIPSAGMLYFSRSLDVVGILTQDLEGAILAAEVLCNDWSKQPEPSVSKEKPVLGIPIGEYLEQASPEALDAFNRQIAIIEEEGFQIQRIAILNDIQAINKRHRLLTEAELAREHREWFARYASLYRPRTVERIQFGQGVSEDDYSEALRFMGELRRKIEWSMQEAGIDLLITPASTPGPAPKGLTNTGNTALNLPWTYALLPAVNIPAGLAANGLPLGLQLVGPMGADKQLLFKARRIAAIFPTAIKQ